MRKKVLILSNGHGEDTVGAALANEFINISNIDVRAFPLVDLGKAYEDLAIPILGKQKLMPSGGFTLHSLSYFWQDIKAGLPALIYQQIQHLKQLEVDSIVVVGDIYALALSSFVTLQSRFYLQPLVSAYHQEGKGVSRPNRIIMENFTALELHSIRRHVDFMYVRDQATENLLKTYGIDHARFLGNPMLDNLEPKAHLDVPQHGPKVALLPGTRVHAKRSLNIMLSALSEWPEATGLVAWAGGDLAEHQLPSLWQWQKTPAGIVLQQGRQRVYLFEQRFADVLAHSDVVLGTAGTANEQAASLGLPVVAFPLAPHYTPAYLNNQKRLLGQALTLSREDPKELAHWLKQLYYNRFLREAAAYAGKQRMGHKGGAKRIVNDIHQRLIAAK